MPSVEPAIPISAEPVPITLAPERRAGSLTVQISNAAVQVYRAHTGRGPTKSRTFVEPNLVVVELRETLTVGERNLVAVGKGDAVTELRRAYRRLLDEPLVEAVQQLTGRRVQALLSDSHLDPDITIEVFVLESEGG